MKVRLKEGEIKTIKEVIAKFDPQAEIILFGSRADPTKRGGDIDLVISTKPPPSFGTLREVGEH